jgi:hypothetical protein
MLLQYGHNFGPGVRFLARWVLQAPTCFYTLLISQLVELDTTAVPDFDGKACFKIIILIS